MERGDRDGSISTWPIGHCEKNEIMISSGGLEPARKKRYTGSRVRRQKMQRSAPVVKQRRVELRKRMGFWLSVFPGPSPTNDKYKWEGGTWFTAQQDRTVEGNLQLDYENFVLHTDGTMIS